MLFKVLTLFSFICVPPYVNLEHKETKEIIRFMQPNKDFLPDSELDRIAGEYVYASVRFDVNRHDFIIAMFEESVHSPDLKNPSQVARIWRKDKTAPRECRYALRDRISSLVCGAYVFKLCETKYKHPYQFICYRGFHAKHKASFLKGIAKWKKRINLFLSTS